VLNWLNQKAELTRSSWACRWDTCRLFQFKRKEIH